MMKIILAIFSVIFSSGFIFGQLDLNGVWQGVIIKNGQKLEEGGIFYASFSVTEKTISGKTREEIYNTDYFAVKQLKGSLKGNTVRFSQTVIEKKKDVPKNKWCIIDANLTYNDSSGYLEGTYTSLECGKNSGRIILFKSTAQFSDTEDSPLSHAWFKRYQTDLSKGYNAPAIRELERKNFAFQPIYFDYDKAEIRPEYYDFLKKMIRVVNGHTDLRIKVTGHTDADGSDEYNIELSKRRAQALIDFFVSNGLNRDRIEIDFKGEKLPVDNNDTPEGKQRNRRVDFAFI